MTEEKLDETLMAELEKFSGELEELNSMMGKFALYLQMKSVDQLHQALDLLEEGDLVTDEAREGFEIWRATVTGAEECLDALRRVAGVMVASAISQAPAATSPLN